MASILHSFPVIPQRDLVAFPRTIMTLVVTRAKSLAALNAALESEDKRLLLVTQRRHDAETPTPSELFTCGTLVDVVQLLRLSDGTAKVIAEGATRVSITSWEDGPDLQRALVAETTVGTEPSRNLEAQMRAVRAQFERHAALVGSIPQELVMSMQQTPDPLTLGYQVAHHASFSIERKQAILEASEAEAMLMLLLQALQEENDLRELEGTINAQVRSQIGKSQREYFLNEQIKVIERELGVNDEDAELDEFEQQIEKARLSKEAREKAERELTRLSRMAAMSPEATVSRSYLETLLELPWGKYSRDNRDLDRAQRILDEDHFSLEKIKERIVEFLAVHSRVKAMRGPILCLVGPPGVGKTSLARSIARTLNRKFVRVALGGVRDEAEIRGHRRTYIGSMPGKVLQSMRKANSMNPVFLLDEIDKMSSDFRGDPASALLEVLDPEQNKSFNDHYLEIDFDLSRVMFITTANSRDGIPMPLLDRMEILTLSGYTEEEKLAIAQRFLLPRQMTEHGLKPADIEIDAPTLRWLIRSYTREAGVRGLERRVASLCRKAVRRNLQFKEALPMHIDVARVREMLGAPRFKDPAFTRVPEVGVATGLAWTEVGGELLMAEAAVFDGKGGLTLTGKLGEEMQESGKAALSWIRGHAKEYSIPPAFHKDSDIHVHFPEGAVPKDGPSAGITMTVAMISALSGRPARQDIAMTGEITLRGKILRIGGLKEKILAAYREGIREIVLPADNMDDLEDVPLPIRQEFKFHPMSKLEDALALVLLPATETKQETVAPAARPKATKRSRKEPKKPGSPTLRASK